MLQKRFYFFFLCLFFTIINIALGQQPNLILPIGHGGFLNNALFSPDGKKIVTASEDHTAKIWDALNGGLLADLKGHTDAVNMARFSPDGKIIVTVSADHSAIVWDAVSGGLLTELKGHTDNVNSACFSPDGKKVVTASSDNTAKIWDVQSGLVLADLKGHTDAVNNAWFSSDGKKIVTASNDSTAKIWDAQSGVLLVDLKGHTEAVNNACFSPDGKKIVTASDDYTSKIWDAQSGQQLLNLQGHSDVIIDAGYSPDGKKIATASNDSTAKIWDAQTGAVLVDLKHAQWVNSACFSPDSKKIVTASEDEVIGKNFTFAKIWDVQTGTLLANLKGHSWGVRTACFSPDGKRIVTASLDHKAIIWDAQTGVIQTLLKGRTYYVNSAFFSPDGKKIVTSSSDHTAKIWDAQSGTLLKVLRGHLGSVGFSSFSPDGKKIVTSSEDHTGKIWDAQNGTILVDLKGHLQAVYYVNFSPDGKKIVTASADRTAKIWDVQSGKLLANLTGHTKLITNASFSPDGKKIVTSSFDSTVKIWEAETGKLSADLKGHTDRVLCALFSPDGKKIVTGAMDFTAKIWDAASGTILKELKSHTMWVVSACFSPDSKKIITASRDNTAKIWDAGNGNLMYSFFAFDSSEYLIVDKYNHYDGTAAARKILYFTCGTEIVELDQVKDQLWVPNLAERINDGESINAKKLSDLNICNLTPEVEDISSKEGEYHFTIKARQGGLGETVVLVNGIEAKRYKPTALMMNGGNYELIIQKSELNFFLIPGKENPVMVKARTADNTISSRGAIVTAGSDSISPTRPSLYTVMIGVSDYKGDELDLKFAAKDATDISNAVSNAAKKLLNTDGKEHVFMYNLTTDKEHYLLPEKNSIKKTLEEIGKKATANDILFIFFAGHGIMSTRTGTDREGLPAGQAEDKKQFYFLTADASKTSATDAIADVGISTAELTEWIKPQNIKAQKRILIFDACNSGQAIKDFVKMGEDNQNYMAARNDDKAQQIKAIDKLNEKSGLFILSASASNQNAYEMGRYSQGLLTYSLLKAIKQQPDILDDGKYLNISRWFNAVEKTVSDLSKESGARQEPQIVTNTNFNIGIVDDEVMAKIVLPMEKPLFTACNFQNNDEAIGDDDLELSKMINLQLNEIAARGTDSKIVYVTATNSPEAFALTGRYEVKENSLTVKVNVKQNKEIKYRFELRGTKDKLKELAAAISQKAATWAAEIK